jgi:SAM-dependent methyltransferase
MSPARERDAGPAPASATTRIGFRHYAGIFLLSLATLLLELSLTRVLSVTLWYHFGFLVISTALLGFGTSGVVLSVWTRVREAAPLDPALAGLSISFGVTTVVSFAVSQRIPFDPLNVLGDPRQLALVPLAYLVLAVPFFCSGLAIALLLTRGAREVNRLYAADLVGAGAGCAAVALTLPALGGAGSTVAAAALGLLAAAVFGAVRARALAVTGALLAAATAGAAGVADRAVPIAVSPHKQHPLADPGRASIFTAWNSFSRIEVFELPPRPGEGWPTAGLSIVIDGGSAGTGMGDLSDGVQAFLGQTPAYRPPGIAYVGKERPRVLVIGSGAGREVLEALSFGAAAVTAVEVNPIITDIVARRMKERWGGLFERPEVRLVTDEARSFVRRSRDQYDAIIAIQTISNAAIAAGALSLAESYVFTREAIAEYLDRLTPDGILLVTGPPTQIARLFATVREIFAARGLGDPAPHLVAFTAALAPYGPRQNHSGLLLKRSPFTAEELALISRRLGGNGIGEPARLLYSPLDRGPGTLFHAILRAPDLPRFYADQAIQLAPSTDDWPFFNAQARWARLDPRSLYWAFSRDPERSSGVPPVELVTVAALLAQSTIIAALLILGPLSRFSRQGLSVRGRWGYLTYFAGLGLGFIVIEIVLLQRFTLFLGQPVYTFAVILASLLVFTGIGSYLSDRAEPVSLRALARITGAIILVLAVTTLATPHVFAAAIGLSLPWRVLVAVVSLAPIGILLGMPFPLGVRIVSAAALPLVPWAWGVNGFFTVIGSVVAVILAMASGFTAALAFAGVCYVVALGGMAGVHAGHAPAPPGAGPDEPAG